MFRKKFMAFCLAAALATGFASTAYAEPSSITMENCGAYLFEWRPIDYGNGQAFAILVGGNTISESDVILNRGYDYAYTFNSQQYARPWGQVPELVNINGVWGIPENWPLLPAGAQQTTRIVLVTNNKNMNTNERYVDVVSLPAGVNTAELPAEVRKYLINVDGSDAGAYDGTTMAGWERDDAGRWFYRKPDGTFVTSSWLTVDEKTYYMNEEGVMLADTITPDGVYVNSSGERTEYFPGWVEDGGRWRYVMKNGYYAANTWLEDNGLWYHFDLGAYLETDTITSDGYYVDANGVWDGQPSTISASGPSIGPAGDIQEGWEQTASGWKYRQAGGSYVSNGWFQAPDSKWYYFGADSVMLADTTTPDGYHVDSSGAWDGQPAGTV